MRSFMSEVDGYVLRIATKQWASRVFNMAIYFTSMRRKWRKGQTVLFMQKTDVGDAFVGYGLIEKALDSEDLCEQDKLDCEKGRWKGAIELRYVKRFEKPLAVRDTFLKSSKLRGRYFHGFALRKDELDCILAQAET
jgi:hypothetical protein